MKKFIFSMLVMATNLTFSQQVPKVIITSMSVTNCCNVNQCGNIDFGLNSTVTLSFSIELTKDHNQVIGNSDLYVYTIGTTGQKIERKREIIQTTNFDTSFSTSAYFTMSASDFNTTGGTLFAVLKSSGGVEYSSTSATNGMGCAYTITKPQLPTFNLSPASMAISCGSTTPVNFTVTNVYNSPGTLTYTWFTNGSGWRYTGVGNLPFLA